MNEGEREVKGVTNAFQSRACIFQIAKVTKPLLAAAQVARAGFITVLAGPGEESYLWHKKTGEKTQLQLENGAVRARPLDSRPR